MYYYGCYGVTCDGTTIVDIYLTYEDAVNKTNKVMNAIENAEYCKKIGSVSYDCDVDKIARSLENVKTINFYYKKVNNNYVFDHYEIK